MTVKQHKFVAYLLGPANGNQTQAARLAGYKGDNRQLAVQGSINMRNPKVQQLLREKFDPMLESSMETYAQALGATKRKAFLTKTSEIIYSDPEPNWKVRMQAADRVLECVQRSSYEDGDSEVHVDLQNGEDSESRERIAALNATDQNLVARAAQIDERPADVQDRLSEDNDGPARPDEN